MSSKKNKKNILIGYIKKALCVLTVSALVFGLMGCNASSAKSTVTKFCESLKLFDAKGMAECAGKEIESFDFEDFDNVYAQKIFDTVKNYAKNIKYEIIDEKNDGNKVYITVKFTYSDLSIAFGKAVSNLLSNALALAFSGKTDDETITNMFVEKFNEVLNLEKITTNTKDIVFTCTKNDLGWVIIDLDSDGITDVALSGIMSAVNNLSNIF